MSVRLFIRKSVLWTTREDNILASLRVGFLEVNLLLSASISSYIVSKTTMQVRRLCQRNTLLARVCILRASICTTVFILFMVLSVFILHQIG